MAEAQASTRAIVLGGGGLTGVAWLTGVLARCEARGTPIGDADLRSKTMPEPVWVALIALYLHTNRWPGPALAVTAVRALDGTLRVFREAGDVHVSRAVAASCAVPRFFRPVEIDGDRYVDGGIRSLINADLAAGHAMVLVFVDHHASLTGAGPLSQAAMDKEIAELRESGQAVLVVAPDEASLTAMGEMEALDPDHIKPAARAGHRQGEQEAERIAAQWPSR